MGIMGYITGIPVFCDSEFVVLSPISRAMSEQSNKSLAIMATALSGGLYATHCLVPPTPGPIAMAGTLNADLGLTILVGLLISIPATFIVQKEKSIFKGCSFFVSPQVFKRSIIR